MDEQNPVDLRALEPERWETVVGATMRRVEGVLAVRRRDPLTLIAGWSRSLTIAAGVAIVGVLIPVEVVLEYRESEVERVESLVWLSTRTALGAEAPTGEEIARALGPDLLP